jgi:acyl-CoA hydrolase
MEMVFHTRKWVKPEDLNPNQSLFGGRLLQWIDEEAVIYAIVQLETPRVVTKYVSEINFISAPRMGDIIEIGIVATDFGASMLTVRCEVRNVATHQQILTIDRMVFASVNEKGKPIRHGKTQVRIENEVRDHYFVD